MRVVLDTNIMVSALLWSGNEQDVVALCLSKAIQSVTSQQIMYELERVLIRKFHEPVDDVLEYIKEFMSQSENVVPYGELRVLVSDPDDNMILETAITGNAAAIITGDSHLLSLRSYEGVEIMRAKEFLDIYQVDPRNSRGLST